MRTTNSAAVVPLAPLQLSKELYCCASVVFQTRLEFLALCGHYDGRPPPTSVNIAVRFVQSGQCISSLSDSSFSRPFARFSGHTCVSHEQDNADTTVTSAYAVDFWYAESNNSFREWILGDAPTLSVNRNDDHGGGHILLRRLPVPDLRGTWIDPHHRDSAGRASRRYITAAFGSLSFSGIASYSADERWGSSVGGAAGLIPWTFAGEFQPSSTRCTRAHVVFEKETHGNGAEYAVEVLLLADAKYIFWYSGESAQLENVWRWESALPGADDNHKGKCDVRCANGRGDCCACADGGLCCGEDQHYVAVDHCLCHGAHGVRRDV